jgi:hypothetical protein
MLVIWRTDGDIQNNGGRIMKARMVLLFLSVIFLFVSSGPVMSQSNKQPLVTVKRLIKFPNQGGQAAFGLHVEFDQVVRVVDVNFFEEYEGDFSKTLDLFSDEDLSNTGAPGNSTIRLMLMGVGPKRPKVTRWFFLDRRGDRFGSVNTTDPEDTGSGPF